MNVKRIKALTEHIDGKMVAIASSETIDRVGDSLKLADWDFRNFKKNPVLLAGHDYRPQYVIGVAKNIRIEKNKVIFEPVFHKITNLAKEIGQMFEEGILKAWSVGFIPGDKNELLEVSAVAVPANAEALMMDVKSLDGAKQKEFESQIKDFVDGEMIDEKPVEEDKIEEKPIEKDEEEEEKNNEEDETDKNDEQDEEKDTIDEENTENLELQEEVTKSANDKPETISEELDEEEKRKQKYQNLNKVDNLFYAFYKVYLDKNTEVGKFSELVKELSELLLGLSNSKKTISKELKDLTGGLDEIFELVQKEGRVLSDKNRELITNCVSILKDSATALDTLLAATESTKKEVVDKSPDPVVQEKVEMSRKVLKNSLSKEQMTVQILKEIAKYSSYGLNKLKK